MHTKMLPCTLMRGGTSKAIFFLRGDLPAHDAELKSVILQAFGRGSRRGVDGLGGLDPLANKVAVISPSTLSDVDVDYLFLQIADLEQGVIDDSINCGNILSAVAPYALEKGMVPTSGTTTARVRIRNVNTGVLVHASMETHDGRPVYVGDQKIPGVPGAGAPIELNFHDVLGSMTGKLFPSGSRSDEEAGVSFTLIDAAVPLLIVRASAFGKTGYETVAQLNADDDLLKRVRDLRLAVAAKYGLGDVGDKVYPKLAMIAEQQAGGHICSRYFVPSSCHAAYAVTGALTLGIAARLEGTLAHELVARRDIDGDPDKFRIEHPSGHMDVYVGVDAALSDFKLRRLATIRTARKIMDGAVFVEPPQ